MAGNFADSPPSGDDVRRLIFDAVPVERSDDLLVPPGAVSLSGGDWLDKVGAWADTLGLSGDRALREVLDDPSAGTSLVGSFVVGMCDAIAQLWAAYGAGTIEGLLEPRPPIVFAVPTRATGRRQPLRIAIATPFTDRDAFVEALLGRPVPRTPRYAMRVPASRLDLTGSLPEVARALGLYDAQLGAADLVDIRSEARAAGALDAEDLGWVVERMFARLGRVDRGLGALGEALHRADPQAFAASPLGRFAAALARGVKRPAGVEWPAVLTLELGPLVVLVGLWDPSDVGLRQHRRPMAAHLRYRMDYEVAPWHRFADLTRRREVLLLCTNRRVELFARFPFVRRLAERDGFAAQLDPPLPTIAQLATGLRRRYAEEYAEETEATTLHRLYKTSSALSRGKRGPIPRDRPS